MQLEPWMGSKHVAIRKAPRSIMHLYHNYIYKGFFSIVMPALVNADYKFRWIDVCKECPCFDAQLA